MPPIKQWVNLDPSHAKIETLRDVPGVGKIPLERCGPVLKLKAKITPASAGKAIYWVIELGADNLSKKLDNQNVLAGWKGQGHYPGFAAPKFYYKVVPTNAKGLSLCEVRLSEVGGDEFTIFAYKKSPSGKIWKKLQSETYVVWRQLYYQVTRMRPMLGKQVLPMIPDIKWAGVQGEYDDSRKPHNLRWSSVPAAKPLITRHRSLWKDELTQKTGVEGYNRAYEPLVVKVSLVDLMAERCVEKHTLLVVAAKTSYTYNFRKLLFDLNSVNDRDDWLWACKAYRTDDASVKIKLQKTDFTKTGPASISVQLSEIPRDCGQKNAQAYVETWLAFFTGWSLGLSWYNGIWAISGCIDWPAGAATPSLKAATADAKVATMIHELGHSIGMVPPASPKHYIKHDHVGNHCWNGATDPSTLATIDTPFPTPTGAICTMFGDDSSGTEKFCDICSPFVRSRRPSTDGKFKTANMLPTTW